MKTPLHSVLEVSSPEERLKLLLDAWSARRLARTAALIAIVSGRVSSSEQPKARGAGEAHAHWLKVARERAPRDLEWLCRNIVAARYVDSMTRVDALASWPSDPRLAQSLLALVRERPFTSVPARPFWTALFRLLSRIIDATALPTIDGLLEGAGVANFDAYIHDKLRALRGQIARRRPLDVPLAFEEQLLDAIDAALVIPGETAAQKTEAEFLAEIWASPLDDGPREVFSDWLLERGNSRGELIALQMMRARGAGTAEGLKRERVLLGEHARAWMGPLEPAIHGKAFRFERGFLFFAKIDWRALLAVPGLVKHPAWGTVREYDLAPAGEQDCDTWLDHMIALGSKRR